jgi:hypothetical protein
MVALVCKLEPQFLELIEEKLPQVEKLFLACEGDAPIPEIDQGRVIPVPIKNLKELEELYQLLERETNQFRDGIILITNWCKWWIEVLKEIGVPFREVYKVVDGEFINLTSQLDLIQLTRDIEVFLESWFFPNPRRGEVLPLRKDLAILSTKLREGNVRNVWKNVDSIKNLLRELKSVGEEGGYLFLPKRTQEMMEKLERELNYIYALSKIGEREPCRSLYRFADIYYQKGEYALSVNFLYNSILCYLDQVVDPSFEVCKMGLAEVTRDRGIEWQECLRHSLTHLKGCTRRWFREIKGCKEFRERVIGVTQLRNALYYQLFNLQLPPKELRQRLQEHLEFFREYLNPTGEGRKRTREREEVNGDTPSPKNSPTPPVESTDQ